MSDSEQSFLKDVIREVLPHLSAAAEGILEEQLQSIGVESCDDLRFVQESDLLSALRPVQARKLLAAWKLKYQTPENSSQSSVGASPLSTQSLRSVSPRSSPSTSSGSPGSATQLRDNFEIPWKEMPEEIMQCLERGKRLDPILRRRMVRIVVKEVTKSCTSIGKKQAVEVAKKMVAKYPKSLQDVIEGDVVGTGYDSLVKQLLNRIDNSKRDSVPLVRKRKRQTDDSDTDEVPPEKRAAMQDTYGCTNWYVKFLPIGETTESQQQKKEKLKVMSQELCTNKEEVTKLMKSTFYTQRKEVNQGKSIKDLKEEWPVCFEELGMSVHFKELTGIDLQETFTQNLDIKGKRLLNYLTKVCVNKSKKFLQSYTRLQIMRGQLSGCSEDVKDMVLLLLSYFGEKEESMFYFIEDTSLAEEVRLEEVPLTPTVIVCGQSCYSAKRFMLSLDRIIVHGKIPNFISAVCLMFGSYYNFNIDYPTELASTLEFLQRCFFSINPEKGTKVDRKNTRRLTVNPRVLTLIQELADHEWRDS